MGVGARAEVCGKVGFGIAREGEIGIGWSNGFDIVS